MSRIEVCCQCLCVGIIESHEANLENDHGYVEDAIICLSFSPAYSLQNSKTIHNYQFFAKAVLYKEIIINYY